MKKEWKKILVACVAIMCVIFPYAISALAVEGGTIKELSGGGISQEYSDIAEFRTELVTREDGKIIYSKEVPAPSSYSDYVFAGWYVEDTCKTTLDPTVTSGTYYAKFVPKKVLGVKAQIVVGTQFNSQSSKIRFATSVDSGNYQLVGFDFELNGGTTYAETDRVYKRLEAYGADERLLNYSPAKTFHTMSKYFMACTVTGVQNEDFGHGIYVTPYWITMDGTKVYGDPVMKTINMGYMPYATGVTVSKATEGIDRPISTDSTQGGCTDGTYYYEAMVSSETLNGLEGTDSPTTGTTKIQRYVMQNNSWVADKASSVLLPLAHANDMTFNNNLTFDNQGNIKGLLVVCHNQPGGKRVSFVDPNELTMVLPSEIKDLQGNSMGWNTESTELKYIEVSDNLFSIDYNAARDQYVVGIGGTKNFRILNAKMEVVGDIHTGNVPHVSGLTNQGVGSDDNFIYFIIYRDNNYNVDGYGDNDVIAVYDWDGNPVTVINVTVKNGAILGQEPENISIYNNTIYVSYNHKLDYNTGYVYKVDSMAFENLESVAEITRNEDVFGYFTLEDAMADAQKGETIKLLKDVTVNSTMEMLASNVTLTADQAVTITRGNNVTMIDVSEDASLTIDKNITIDGNNLSATTSAIRNNGTMTLRGTLSNHVAPNASGAAVRSEGGTLTIDGAKFEDNEGRYGGAVFVKGSVLTVQNEASFTNNTGNYTGGAIYIENDGEAVTIQDSTFTSNAIGTDHDNAKGGGAIFAYGTEVSLTNNTFTSNTSKKEGGAIFIRKADVNSEDCRFEANTSDGTGAAIYLYDTGSTLTATSDEFVDNVSAEEHGGSVYNNNRTIHLNGCQFTNDTVVSVGTNGVANVSGAMSMTGTAGFVYADAKQRVNIAEAGLTGTITITPSSYKRDYVAVGGAIANNASQVVVTPNEGYPYEVTTEGMLDLQGELKNAEAAISSTQYGTLSDMLSVANADTKATLENPVVITVLDQDFEISTTHNITGHVKFTTIKDNAVSINRAIKGVMLQIGTSSATDASLNIDGVITLDGKELDSTNKHFIRNYGTFTLGATACIQNSKDSTKYGVALYSTGTAYVYGTVQNNYNKTGKGAIRIDDAGTLHVDGATFYQNTGAYGGAIFGENAKISIESAEFNTNTATSGGGAIYCQTTDGTGTLNITDTEFKGNKYTSTSTTYGGGAICSLSGMTATLTNCTFLDNTTKANGASVFNKGGEVTVIGGTFNDQTFVNQNTGGTTTVSGLVTGLAFVNNTDSVTTVIIGKDGLDRGSSISIKPKSYTADRFLVSANAAATEEQTAKNLANAVNTIDVVQQAAAYWYISDDGKLTQATAGVGTHEELVAAIAEAPTDVTNTTIYIKNDITLSETLSINQGQNITLKGARGVKLTRTEDIVMFDVGSSSAPEASLAIEGGIIIDANKNVTAETNNLIRVRGTFTLGRNATIQNVNSSKYNRRAIYGYGTAKAYIYGTLSGNASNSDGAAIKMSASDGKLYVDGAIFQNNSSNSYGAAISLNASGITATIKNATFINNTSKATGGAAIYSASNMQIDGGSFENNSSVSGGAIYLAEGTTTTTINNASFTNNKATTGTGGAIYVGKNCTLNIDGGTFESNTSQTQGGAMYISSSTTTEIKNARFEKNTVTAQNSSGGAIVSNGPLTLESCTFTENVADSTAGAVLGYNANLTVTTCVFTDNKSNGGNCGAIALDSTEAEQGKYTLTVHGGTFKGNQAWNAGAIRLHYASIVADQNCSFIENKANNNGGAIHINKGSVSISLDSLTFTGNTAKAGNAIYNATTSQINHSNCTFEDGQAIYPAN